MDSELLPDSPAWSYHNSENIADINPFFIAYCATSKIILLSIHTGKAFHVLASNTQNGKPRKAHKVCLNEAKCAAGFSDGNISVWEIVLFKEINNYEVGSEISGLKWWNDFLICLMPSGKCLKLKDGEKLVEWDIGIPRCIRTSPNYLVIPVVGKVKIFENDKEIDFDKDSVNVDIKEWDDGFYLALIDLKCIRGYKNMQRVFELRLPVIKKKTLNIYALNWLSKEKCVYSNALGEIHLINTKISQTQLFINNPHNKAIMSLLGTQNGLISIGMDRLIVNWKVESIEIEGPTPRVSNSPLAYTEPMWSLACLEGSVHSMSIDPAAQIYVCSGKLALLKWTPGSESVQSRIVWNSNEEMQQISCNNYNSDYVSILTVNQQPLVFSVPEEKVLQRLDLLKAVRITWMNESKIILGSADQSLFVWDITTQNLKSIAHVGFEITALLYNQEKVWIGTQEGNILVYSLDGSRVYADITHTKAITCIAAKERVAVSSEDGKISVHSLACDLVLDKHTRPVLYVAWSPHDDNRLASSSMDHTVQIWDTLNGIALINIREHQGAVRFVVWHPTIADVVISGSDDQTIRLWSLKKKFSSQVPPRLPLSKKNEIYTKTFFSHLHFYVYQQNREECLDTLISLLTNFDTVQHKLFSLNQKNALDLLNEASAHKDQIEFLFWKRSAEREEIVDTYETIKLDKDWSDLAPLLGENQWREESRKNAEEMLLRRKIHKAVLYFLAARNVKKAMEIYVNANLFIEALILGALHSEDISEIYRMWAKRLIGTSKQEQAIKCYIGIKDYTFSLQLVESLQYSNAQISNLIEILKSKII